MYCKHGLDWISDNLARDVIETISVHKISLETYEAGMILLGQNIVSACGIFHAQEMVIMINRAIEAQLKGELMDEQLRLKEGHDMCAEALMDIRLGDVSHSLKKIRKLGHTVRRLHREIQYLEEEINDYHK